jgi:phage terminase large subunit
MFKETTATKRISALTKRIRCIQGGTSASKTISALLYLIARAQMDKTPTLTSVVSESFPHLKRGAMRDFLLIMEQHNYYDDKRWNRSDYVYTFETGSKIEFFSADQPGKVRGPRRDRLFINEANNVPYEAFDQLEVRTKEFIIIDWNPVAEFWVYDHVIGKRDDAEHIILTYRDNEAPGGRYTEMDSLAR